MNTNEFRPYFLPAHEVRPNQVAIKRTPIDGGWIDEIEYPDGTLTYRPGSEGRTGYERETREEAEAAVGNPRNAGRKPKGRQPCGWRLAPDIIEAVSARAAATGQSQNDAAEEVLRAALQGK